MTKLSVWLRHCSELFQVWSWMLDGTNTPIQQNTREMIHSVVVFEWENPVPSSLRWFDTSSRWLSSTSTKWKSILLCLLRSSTLICLHLSSSILPWGFGGAVVRAPSTSELVDSILATDSCEKSPSTLCWKSWVFSRCSGFLPRGKLTGYHNCCKNKII
jgi:hypothetical protein